MGDGAQDIGATVTAGLAAREIDRGHGAAAGHDHGSACANCRAALMGPHCHQCGQAGHVHRTAAAFLHDIGHGVFHFEGRAWHTLPMLAWRPGALTRRYIDGERVRFVSPMALFLFSVFLMFASIGLVTHDLSFAEGIGGPNLRTSFEKSRKDTRDAIRDLTSNRAEAVKEGEIARVATIDRKIASQRSDLRSLENIAPIVNGTAVGRRGAPSHVNIGVPKLDAAVNHAIENPQLAIYKLKSAAYKYSWALIPISLPFIWLLFPFSRRFGLYDHAIFATYSLAFMTLLIVAASVASWAGVASALIWTVLLLVPPIHMYRQMKGTYLLGRWNALFRTFLLVNMTGITIALFAILLLYLGLA